MGGRREPGSARRHAQRRGRFAHLRGLQREAGELFERRPHWGEDREGHVRVDLSPLPRRHIEEMIRDRLQAVPQISPELVRLISDRAEGYPRIAAETLHLLVDTGVIEIYPDKPWKVHDERMGELSLPTTVQGIVQERIDRLDPDSRVVLVRAAVIGRCFWQGALEHLCGDLVPRGSSLDSHLESLRERLLVRRRRPSSIPDEQEYMFVDSATYEVAYQMPSRKVFGPLHLLVAEWMQGKLDEQSSAIVAVHFDRGEDLPRAAMAYERAALHAAALGENTEALRHLERARDIHDDLMVSLDEPGASRTAAPPIVTAADRVRVRIELGDVLRRTGRLDDAERVYEEARERLAEPVPGSPEAIPRTEYRALSRANRLSIGFASAGAGRARGFARADRARHHASDGGGCAPGDPADGGCPGVPRAPPEATG